MNPKLAIDRMVLAARGHARILSLVEITLDMKELESLRERFELELRRAYTKGYNACDKEWDEARV